MCFGLYREQSFGSGDTYQEPICRAQRLLHRRQASRGAIDGAIDNAVTVLEFALHHGESVFGLRLGLEQSLTQPIRPATTE